MQFLTEDERLDIKEVLRQIGDNLMDLPNCSNHSGNGFDDMKLVEHMMKMQGMVNHCVSWTEKQFEMRGGKTLHYNNEDSVEEIRLLGKPDYEQKMVPLSESISSQSEPLILMPQGLMRESGELPNFNVKYEAEPPYTT